jgi:hypothetical protein
MKMKTTLSLVAAAVALLSQSAFAQTTRAERKSDTASAVKSGETMKAGEGGPAAAKPTQSSKTREQRKAETAGAVKAGETQKAGEAPMGGGGKATPTPQNSTTTRAERKATTSEAVKAGETQKAGEGSPTAPKK